jgi:putative holliday junction resolvase
MRILSIDYGTKRTGLAISDPLGLTAQPLKTISTKNLLKELRQLHKEYQLTKIILGFPLLLRGEEGPAAKNMRQVQQQLSQQLPLTVELIDERLSTATVQKTLLAGQVSRAKRRQVIDKLAATYLLQNYLDSIRSIAKKIILLYDAHIGTPLRQAQQAQAAVIGDILQQIAKTVKLYERKLKLYQSILLYRREDTAIHLNYLNNKKKQFVLTFADKKLCVDDTGAVSGNRYKITILRAKVDLNDIAAALTNIKKELEELTNQLFIYAYSTERDTRVLFSSFLAAMFNNKGQDPQSPKTQYVFDTFFRAPQIRKGYPETVSFKMNAPQLIASDKMLTDEEKAKLLDLAHAVAYPVSPKASTGLPVYFYGMRTPQHSELEAVLNQHATEFFTKILPKTPKHISINDLASVPAGTMLLTTINDDYKQVRLEINSSVNNDLTAREILVFYENQTSSVCKVTIAAGKVIAIAGEYMQIVYDLKPWCVSSSLQEIFQAAGQKLGRYESANQKIKVTLAQEELDYKTVIWDANGTRYILSNHPDKLKDYQSLEPNQLLTILDQALVIVKTP